MKKINSLFIIVIFISVCSLFEGCKVSQALVPIINNEEDKAIEYDLMMKNDSIVRIALYYKEIGLDSLSSIIASLYKKDKIDITGWPETFDGEGSSRQYYLRYRLVALYGLNLIEISGDPDWRLEFYIQAVNISDYDFLDHIDFDDEAFNRDSCNGYTVLTRAVNDNNVKMVKYLLEHGVDKEKREFTACYDDAQEGMNAYEIAKMYGYEDIMELLK